MRFSKRVSGLKPSPVFELLKEAEKMKKEGKDVISLSIGELDWGTYDVIKKAGKKAIDENHTKYTGSAGREALRKKISEEAARIYGLDAKLENVAVSAGCKYALFVLFQILCDAGDEVIFPAPYWMSYPDIVGLSGATPVIVSTDEASNFKITASQLRNSITDQTRIFLLNSPNNPTSTIYTKEELQSLGEVLKDYPKIFIVTDDIYDQIVFSGKRAPHFFSACPYLKNRILALNGASKNYLMTGWRISWIIASKDLIKVFSSFQSQSISCVNSIAQKALEDSMDLCEQDIQNMVSRLKELRDFFSKGINQIPGLKEFPSEGAFYLWVSIKSLIGKNHKGFEIKSSRDFMRQLFMKKNLLCLSGEEFGATGYLRFSYGLEKEVLNKALSRLSEFVSELT